MPRGSPPLPALRSREEALVLFEQNRGLIDFCLGRAFGERACEHPHVRRVGLEEVRQRGLYQLWRCACAFDPSRNRAFSTYAVRCIIPQMSGRSRFSQTSKHQHLSLGGDSEWVRDLHFNTVRQAIVNEHGRIVRAALRCLPARDARIIALRYFEGMFLDEVGAVLGRSRARAQQIEARALVKLQKRPELRRLVAR